MRVGRIYHHAEFYGDSFSGELLGKYLVILAFTKAGDVVFRVLTSRHAPLRPSGCHHGTPYPGFSLGVPGGVLTRPTWVDLREQDDYDSNVFQGRIDNGLIRPQQQLHSQQLREIARLCGERRRHDSAAVAAHARCHRGIGPMKRAA